MNWWSRLWRRGEMEEELDKELRFHLEQHTEDLIARGHSPEEARRQARLALGGPEQVKERCRDARGTRWLEDVWQDLRYGARMLWKQPGFTLVAVLTLTLGIGANTAIFSLVYAVVYRPLPYQEVDQLVRLKATLLQKNVFDSTVSYPTFRDWQEQSTAFAQVAAYAAGARGLNLTGGDLPERLLTLDVSGEIFSLLGVNPALGRTFTPDEALPGANLIVMSHELWRRRFQADPNLIGQTITLHDQP